MLGGLNALATSHKAAQREAQQVRGVMQSRNRRRRRLPSGGASAQRALLLLALPAGARQPAAGSARFEKLTQCPVLPPQLLRERETAKGKFEETQQEMTQMEEVGHLGAWLVLARSCLAHALQPAGSFARCSRPAAWPTPLKKALRVLSGAVR